jgi:hypothetical protein
MTTPTLPKAISPLEKLGILVGPTDKEPKKINPRAKLLVHLLPSTCDKVIVQYYPSFRINCVLPAQVYKVQAYGRDRWGAKPHTEVDHKAPPVMFSATYCSNVQFSAFLKNTTGAWGHPNFQLFQVDLKRNKAVWGRVYKMPNVYGNNGNICWGGVSVPQNLRAANSRFWSTPFNGDLSRASTTEGVAKYMGRYRIRSKWLDITQQVCGDRWVACKEHVDGVIFTNRKSLLKLVPKEDQRELFAHRKSIGNAVIALGNKLPQGDWVFTTGNFTFRISGKKLKFRRGS